MFRGFARRRASNAHLDREAVGKENDPSKVQVTPKSAAKRSSVFQDNNRNKTTRLDGGAKSKQATQQTMNGGDSVEMMHAFDQLLVSSRGLPTNHN